MSTDENELRYDRHKRKSKRRRKSKKNKTGKKRARIQVGGGKKKCPFCSMFFWNKGAQNEKVGEMITGCARKPICVKNIKDINNLYKPIKEATSLDGNNVCDICGLDNNEFKKIKSEEILLRTRQILTGTLANRRGIQELDVLKQKLQSKAPAPTAPAPAPAKPPSHTPSTTSAASTPSVANTTSAASAVGPSLDQKDAKIQEHEATIATQKALIQEKAAIIDKQTSQLTEKDTIISTHKSTIDDRDEVVSRSTADKKREIEELTKQHSAELRQKDVQLDAMVEEKTTAKISDMFKPIGASSVFYVKISEDNAVDKLETIIEKLQKLKDQSEGEQRVGERRSSRRRFGKGKGKGKRGAGGGSVEVLSDVEDDDIFDAVAINQEELKQEELKQKVKQNVLEPIGSDSDGADQAYPTPPPSPQEQPQEQPPTKGEITTTV